MKKLLYGADYNPDQWLDHPEILAKDIEYMKKARINCVTINIFGWSTLEPAEGQYHLDWLKDAVDRLYEAGISTIMATPSGAIPNWLSAKYPEVLQVRENGVRNLPGGRHNFCYTSPVMREKVKQHDHLLGKTFARHPGLIMWHISNEMGGNGYDASCHCDACQKAFRLWLEERYGSLEQLNHAWWTNFWSHTYTDWEQISSPQLNGELQLHGLNLDWKRFVTHQMIDFYQMEYDTVKAVNQEIPVTTNFMEYFKPLDYFKFKDRLDIVSWDSYPNWHGIAGDEDEVSVAVSTAVNHNIMRSIKKQPFLLMESTPSLVNWKPYNRAKKPGMNMLASMQAIAHGSDSVLYFQWRMGRGAYEKHHGAVIDHYGETDTRVFAEVEQLGRRIATISPAVSGTVNHPKVAVIFDWENWWALDDAAGPSRNMNYTKVIESHYRPFWEMGIDVDVIDMEQSLDGYQLIIAPMSYMIKAVFAERIKAFVQNGGSFVTTYWSGIVDETDLCYLGGVPGKIREMLGIRAEELDALPQNERVGFDFRGNTYYSQRLIASIKVETAEVLGTYSQDVYQGKAAVTKKACGNGNAYYLSGEHEVAFLKEFYRNLAQDNGISPGIKTELPYGVTVTMRTCENYELLFVQNFNDKPVRIELDRSYELVDTGDYVEGEVVMKPYECMLIKK